VTLGVNTERDFLSNSYVQMQRNIYHIINHRQNYKIFYYVAKIAQEESLVVTTVIAFTLLQIGCHDLLISVGLVYTPACLLGLRVRIPPWAWVSASCECCVLSG
jgi:hypothetical protein